MSSNLIQRNRLLIAFRKIGGKLLSCNFKIKKIGNFFYYEGSLCYVPKLMKGTSTTPHSAIFEYIDVQLDFCLYDKPPSYADEGLEYLIDFLENLQYTTWKKSQKLLSLMHQMPSTTFKILDTNFSSSTNVRIYLRNESSSTKEGFANFLQFFVTEKSNLKGIARSLLKNIATKLNTETFLYMSQEENEREEIYNPTI